MSLRRFGILIVGTAVAATLAVSHAAPPSAASETRFWGNGGDASFDNAAHVSSTTVHHARGAVTKVWVNFTAWHTWPGDLDVLLTGPNGRSVVLMSDACGNRGDSSPTLRGEAVTIADDAPVMSSRGPCGGGRYGPTDYAGETADGWPTPPTDYTLGSAFNGIDPNGEWRLSLIDDMSGSETLFLDWNIWIETDYVAPTCHGRTVTIDLARGDYVPSNNDDVILGTPGPDIISGHGGNDIICGLGGNDVIEGGGGDDVIDGGPGRDAASYASSTTSVSVSLATRGAQSTGAATGSDALHDVESLYGGMGNDRLTGNSANNTLDGRSGDDRLTGREGIDVCQGGRGTDIAAACETRVSIP